MQANVTRNGNIVAADLDVDIYTQERGGLTEWSGSFSVAHGVVFDGDEYTLELADGNSGRITIFGQGITGGTSTKLVRFQGTGPLQ